MLKDLIALTKPRLNFLVLMSALAAYQLGHSGPFDLLKLLEFAAALFCLAGASSALNMWIERSQDARMKRTARRPLASGRLDPKIGLAFGIVLSAVALAWLYLRINPLTAYVGFATWASYIFVYTPLKRVTSFSTIVGAVPGALPPVMGWTAATGVLSQPAMALFLILFLWQIPHFLAIAVMYADEYQAAGFKVMPFEQGLAATGRQMFLYALALIPCSLMLHADGQTGAIYFGAALVLGLAYFLTAVYAALKGGRKSARTLLLASVLYLPLLLSVMLADRVI